MRFLILKTIGSTVFLLFWLALCGYTVCHPENSIWMFTVSGLVAGTWTGAFCAKCWVEVLSS